MFDTHCHLNFKALTKNLADIISAAHESGVTQIVIPGTDVVTSKTAVEIATSNNKIYAAVGIHPHHVYKYLAVEANSNKSAEEMINEDITEIKALLSHKNVVAVGEVGLDKHTYENTKYDAYTVDEKFLTLQKLLLVTQIQLAITHKKSLILHNREAKSDLLPLLAKVWDESLRHKTVFHCCEPEQEILEFAQERDIYIGVDGDITYYPEKQEFIKKLPLEKLVLETDSPYLLPEPLRTEKKYPNQPKNIKLVAEFIAQLKNIEVDKVIAVTTSNAQKLFQLG